MSNENESKENVVYIGQKPLMSYVYVGVTVFNKGNNEVIFKARGKSINKAVDVTELVRRKFLSGFVEYGEIKISSEEVDGRDSPRMVSSIEITLKKIK